MRIGIDELVLTKENPRTTPASRAAHDALVASLSTHGLIQPIVVRRLQRDGDDPQRFEIIAGSRRFQAIKQLGWDSVEVVENDAEYGIGELGAAENMLREAMHPLDECAVITRLVADGKSMEDVALRFGQTERWTEQRMKLNGLSAPVQKLFRDGTITLAAAQAFTLGDEKQQEAYVKRAKNEWQLEPKNIAAEFSRGAFNAKNALFPLELYPQEMITRDLFGEDVWLDDRKAFQKLQEDAIEALEVKLMKEDGWGQVQVLMNGYDAKIQNRYVKVEGRILKADRAKYACMILHHPGSGAVTVEKGLVLRKDAKSVTPGKTALQDSTAPEAVENQTADDLALNQLRIIAALQTKGIEIALTEGDVHIALLTLLGPLLGHDNVVPWAGGRRHTINYGPVSDMMTGKLDIEDEVEVKHQIPSRKKLGDMTVNDLAPLLCKAALRSMALIPQPDRLADRELKAAGIAWFVPDEGLLKRYRMDALVDLAERLELPVEDDSKTELVKKIMTARGGLPLDDVITYYRDAPPSSSSEDTPIPKD